MGRAVLHNNLPQLQNLIKRDPTSYREEFLQQWNHYNNIREIFKFHPDEQSHHLRELVSFISHVATCYPEDTADFPSHLSTLLSESYGILSPDTRKTLVSNLVMLRNKDVITSIELLRTLFPLLPRTSSSQLRSFIRKTILSDIRMANIRTKNHTLNKAVQAMLFGMVEQGMQGEVQGDKGKVRAMNGPTVDGAVYNSEAAMWAVILTKELWRKRIWTDAKSVSIIAQGCFHPISKVQSASIHFFLNSEEEVEDSNDEDESVDVRALHHRREINKKTRSGEKKIRKQLKAAKKKKYDKKESLPNFPALQLLHDPQSFGEKLYNALIVHDKRFSLDLKILIMQLLSRVMGAHKLCVLGFYTYVVKYIAHRQLRVPSILVALAQSVHDLTPPDAITPVIRKLAQEFIHPGVASEVIAAGLNSIREICRRQPWAMEEDLLGDLIEYRKSRDKSVTAAARGLLRLYREVNPGMLRKRERGKEATLGLSSGNKPLPYGYNTDVATNIPGLSLLEDHLQKLRAEEGVEIDDDDSDSSAWEGWDVESDSSEDESDGWQNVDSDSDNDLVISDSEDENDQSSSKKQEAEQAEPTTSSIAPITSSLAETKILTPADFALLNELRTKDTVKSGESGGGSKTKRKLATVESSKSSAPGQDLFISENDIMGPRKKAKADYLERMASIQKGREGREKFGSHKGKQNKEAPSSSTNREKARNKPVMMILSSGAVRSKKKASLRDKQKKLRKHIDKAKKSR